MGNAPACSGRVWRLRSVVQTAEMANKKSKLTPKTMLKLPDLEQSKSAVLNSLTSRSSQRSTTYGCVSETHCGIGTGKGTDQLERTGGKSSRIAKNALLAHHPEADSLLLNAALGLYPKRSTPQRKAYS